MTARLSKRAIEVAPGTEVIDAQGLWLMPGLVEGHAHLSFCGATQYTDMGDIPPEVLMSLPSPEEIQRRAGEAKAKAGAALALQK